MQLSDFDYELPAELIAQHPPAKRDASRMLIVDRRTGTWRDSEFSSLPGLLNPADALVLNNTKVFPARLIGERLPTGGAVELLLLRKVEPNVWSALARPARRLAIGTRIKFAGGSLTAEVIDSLDGGERQIKFETDGRLEEILDEIGQTPLPPYIKRPGQIDEDRIRYQTIYAQERGSIAAPTAGLHFTKEILEQIPAKIVKITLHVGYGTFQPVRDNDLSLHQVAQEIFTITQEAAGAVNYARAAGGRIFAVGTTTARALESSVIDGRIYAENRLADLTILPGYEFRIVDALLTNFHLPQSSLLLLVSAFAGRDLTLAAYWHAVKEQYRFYSYGDCVLIL
jgi:S-adenosylmethionine:tRNA ribosyltransferase-isomerase